MSVLLIPPLAGAPLILVPGIYFPLVTTQAAGDAGMTSGPTKPVPELLRGTHRETGDYEIPG
jgi:hypothetical protein